MDTKSCQCDHSHELERALMACSQLQEMNAKAQEHLEVVLIEGDRNISRLQQEKHDLELKLSRQLKMAESYQEELEALQRDLALQKKGADKELESRMSEQAARYKTELSFLEGDLEKAKAAEGKTLEQNEKLEVMVEKLKAQLRVMEAERIPNASFSSLSSEEAMEALKKENAALLEENCMLQSKVDKTEKQLVAWKSQSLLKDSEIGKLACESTAYFNENERLKEKIKDLQVQLEVMTMQSNKRQAKGNSLFAEVEDRRVEAEKQLIDIRIENDTLKKQLKLTKDSLNHAKMQLCVKWDLRSAMEYKSRLESVRMENIKLLEENRALHFRLKAFEEEERRIKSVLDQNDRSKVPEARRYQILYESNEKKLADVTKELDSRKLALHMTENRLRKTETELMSTKQELFGVIAEREKLEMRLDELSTKYEPACQDPQKLKKVEYYTEKLNFSSKRKFQATSASNAPPTAPSMAKESIAQVKESSEESKLPFQKKTVPSKNSDPISAGPTTKEGTVPTGSGVLSEEAKTSDSGDPIRNVPNVKKREDVRVVKEPEGKPKISYGPGKAEDSSEKPSGIPRPPLATSEKERARDHKGLPLPSVVEDKMDDEGKKKGEDKEVEGRGRDGQLDNAMSLRDELDMFANPPGRMNASHSYVEEEEEEEERQKEKENNRDEIAIAVLDDAYAKVLKDLTSEVNLPPKKDGEEEEEEKKTGDSLKRLNPSKSTTGACALRTSPRGGPTENAFDPEKNVNSCKSQ